MTKETQKLLNFNEVRDFLRVKDSWLRGAIFKKTIPFIKVGRLIRFNEEELKQWLKRKKPTANHIKVS